MKTLRSKMVVAASVAVIGMAVAGCGGGGGGGGGGSGQAVQRPTGVPQAAQSKTIDAVLERGTLRVGTLALPPWLIQNTGGGGEPFHGASWTLAQAYANKLGVKLETVDVSQDTKVTALQTGQIDVSITPLAETPARKNAVSFVTYSATANCYAGLSSNPKVAAIKTVDDINNPDLSIAYFVGGSQEGYLPTRFPKVQLKGVTGSGSGVPIEQILSHRSDLVVFNTVEWPALVKRYPELIAFPKNCEGSKEQESLIGHAVVNNDPIFLEYLAGIEKSIDSKLQAEIKKDEESAG